MDEIAEYLGVVKASVYRWIGRRSLLAHKVGKLWKFRGTKWTSGYGAAELETKRPPTVSRSRESGDE